MAEEAFNNLEKTQDGAMSVRERLDPGSTVRQEEFVSPQEEIRPESGPAITDSAFINLHRKYPNISAEELEGFLYEYNKLLDPGLTVRQEEIRPENFGNLPESRTIGSSPDNPKGNFEGATRGQPYPNMAPYPPLTKEEFTGLIRGGNSLRSAPAGAVRGLPERYIDKILPMMTPRKGL